MEIINKLSAKEKNLLFVLLTVLILFGSYQLGFQKYTEKSEHLSEENAVLILKLNELQEKAVNKEKYIQETKDMEGETDMMLSHFPTTLTQEKNTIFVTHLESYAEMKVSSISFADNSEFYSLANTQDSTAGSDENIEEAVDTSAETESTDGSVADDTMITGYKTTMVLTYQANYKGLKRCIEYINTYKEKMNIVDLSAAFDHTTGNLTGTITIAVYALGGIDKTDDILEIPGIDIGTENIFGSFDLNVINTTN